MKLTLEVTGLNLEKMLDKMAAEGIVAYGAWRTGARTFRLDIDAEHERRLCALGRRYGWEVRELSAGVGVRIVRFFKRRFGLVLGALVCVLLVWLSGKMVWRVQIDHAAEHVAQVRAVLKREGVVPGTFKRAHSLGKLKEKLTLALPGLAFVGVRWAGSTLIVDGQPAKEGEIALDQRDGQNVIASRDGIVTRLSVYSGTPIVEMGQAVHAGQTLILGEERSEAGTVRVVQAQGDVMARVWDRGDARVSRYMERTVETGQYRTRETLCSPWTRRVTQEAEPFDRQDVSVDVVPLVGLYLPFWREIETFAEIEVVRERRSEGDVASTAQAAAEKMAKLKCPLHTEILDKWVDYSMIDDEFVCATVVLEYEQNIATRSEGAEVRRD